MPHFNSVRFDLDGDANAQDFFEAPSKDEQGVCVVTYGILVYDKTSMDAFRNSWGKIEILMPNAGSTPTIIRTNGKGPFDLDLPLDNDGSEQTYTAFLTNFRPKRHAYSTNYRADVTFTIVDPEL